MSVQTAYSDNTALNEYHECMMQCDEIIGMDEDDMEMRHVDECARTQR